VNTDPNTLLAALYVKVDNKVGRLRCLGRPPRISDADLVCLAVVELHPHRLRCPDREHTFQAQESTPEGLPEPTTKVGSYRGDAERLPCAVDT
jgi:hypothetical protein